MFDNCVLSLLVRFQRSAHDSKSTQPRGWKKNGVTPFTPVTPAHARNKFENESYFK